MAKHFAQRDTEPEDAVGRQKAPDPGSTAMFTQALLASRAVQKTAPTASSADMRRRSRAIAHAVSDPFADKPDLPDAPSAPEPSPYIQPVGGPRTGAVIPPDSTAMFMQALTESRARERRAPVSKNRPGHMREKDYASYQDLAVEEAMASIYASAARGPEVEAAEVVEAAAPAPEPAGDELAGAEPLDEGVSEHRWAAGDEPAPAKEPGFVIEDQDVPEPEEAVAREARESGLSPEESLVFTAVSGASRSAGPSETGHWDEDDLIFGSARTDSANAPLPVMGDKNRPFDQGLAQAEAGEPDLMDYEPGSVEPDGVFEDAEALERPAAIEAPAKDEPARDVEASVGRSAAMMSVLVIVSRLTGFLRTWGQAYALGVTVVASCYTVANNLPNQLYELVIGGMLVTAFLPVYLSVKRRSGVEGASRYASNLVSLVTILMGAVAVLGFVFASQVVLTQSVGAVEQFDHDLATLLFRFFVVEVVLYALSSIVSGVLNAERDYFWSMAAPIFNNVICTASFFGYAFLVDVNPSAAVLVLALGNPAGVLVQVLMQLPSLRRHGIKIRPRIDLHDPALRETLAIGIPSFVVMACSFVTVSVQSSSALSVTASGASVIYYARLWFTLPYAVLAVPITTAMFTELSESFSKGDLDAFKRGVVSGSGRILFFLVPFSLYLVVFAPQLVALLNSGKFTAAEASMTAWYIVMLAIGLPFYGLCMYLQKVCSANRHMRFYAVANVVGSVAQVAVCVFLTPIWGLNMVGISSAVFFLGVDVVTFMRLHSVMGSFGVRRILFSGVRALLVGVVGAAAGAAIVWALGTYAGVTASGLVSGLVLCAAGGIPALVVTYGLAMAFKLPEARFLSSLAGRVSRKAA